MSPGTSYDPREVESAERFMRSQPLDKETKSNNNRSDMLMKFQITRDSRRSFINNYKNVDATTVLNKYPRLKDMKEAVCIAYSSFFFLG